MNEKQVWWRIFLVYRCGFVGKNSPVLSKQNRGRLLHLHVHYEVDRTLPLLISAVLLRVHEKIIVKRKRWNKCLNASSSHINNQELEFGMNEIKKTAIGKLCMSNAVWWFDSATLHWWGLRSQKYECEMT